MKMIIALLLVLVLTAAGLFVSIYSEAYHLAAPERRFGSLRWVLETAMNNSVRDRAGTIETPALDRQNREEGFKNFDRLCVTCHGAPGVYASEIGIGLRPAPPDLSEQVHDRSAAELFWIVNHGFKFTGMPAFGNTHPDETIWDLVAFLKDLPAIPAGDYQKLRQQLGGQDSPQSRPGPLPEQQDQPFGSRQQMLTPQSI